MDTVALAERLDGAVDHLLAVRVALGGLSGPPLPEEALDVALGRHEGFQGARQGFVAALEVARAAGLTDEAIYGVEAAAHHLAGQAAEVGWALGVTARGAGATTEAPR